jgi:hypothetical protein
MRCPLQFPCEVEVEIFADRRFLSLFIIIYQFSVGLVWPRPLSYDIWRPVCHNLCACLHLGLFFFSFPDEQRALDLDLLHHMYYLILSFVEFELFPPRASRSLPLGV